LISLSKNPYNVRYLKLSYRCAADSSLLARKAVSTDTLTVDVFQFL